ncbi:MAG: hypothetical protein F6K42_32665 [Leptolyngbya sp. SIO1D8]|nr:hypothetical protein [Leptolyngbya sp. SIO1D8]
MVLRSKRTSHAILTLGYREEGHPVHTVFERVIEFMRSQTKRGIANEG